MVEDHLYWIWLNALKGIGPVISRRLLESFKFSENMYNALKKNSQSLKANAFKYLIFNGIRRKE